ncbi:hypothetical protein QQG55_10045 [Brugia pahangi]
MHLALIFISSVLFVIHVQSQTPDGCQMAIQSLITTLAQAAAKLDDGQHVELHASVSRLARTIQDYSSQKRTQMTGSRDNCIRAMKSVHASIASIAQKLHATKGNDAKLIAAANSIDAAAKIVGKMLTYRQAQH